MIQQNYLNGNSTELKEYGSLKKKMNNSVSKINDSRITMDKAIKVYRYGFCGWSPDCFQKLNNSIFLLVCLCLVALLQGMVINGFVSVAISTLEKRYGLTSLQTGILAAFYDIVIVVVVIPVTYFATKTNKIKIIGRFIGVSIILMGIGSLIFILPQFITPAYEYQNNSLTSSNFCTNATESIQSTCVENGYTGAHIYVILMIGQLIHGVSCSTIFTITYIIIDENTNHKQSSVYTGIFYGFGVFGPALGYIIGGFLLKVHGDFYRIILPEHLNPDDRNWYGGWWIGFLVASILCFISSIPLFGFGPHLPNFEKLHNERISEAHTASDECTVQMTFGNSLSELPAAVKRLLFNPTYMLLVIGDALDAFLLNGFVIFAPKYLETQFNITPSKASIFAGISLVPGGVTGTIISGIIIRKMHVKNKIRFGAVMFFISIPLIFAFMMQCPEQPIAGINKSYISANQTNSFDLKDKCNVNCGCKVEYEDIVCHYYPGSSKPVIAYASHCWAGCVGPNPTAKNCTCLPVGSTLLTNDECNAKTDQCPYFYPFLVCLFVLVFFTFMAATPTVQGIMRCVPFSQRSLAIGFGWLIARIIGTIPGPIVFGKMIDFSCLIESDCGNCVYYNTTKLMVLTLSFGFILRAAAFIMFLMAAIFYKPSDNSISQTNFDLDTISKAE
ncbi:hypothetical protein A3Q56_00097 [Intoshia linei]|uniref:Solute carrier organic anion transporter family member n=1 Tax=Intoshia linei TaxID=1819745 RepID=A0A177BEV2_9BILA|nr:hypothetical protein A3Q56_00097 [Intoshia linei]